MHDVKALIIGAGQAGLAASSLLTEADHEHVVLERGRIGERWLSSSWDSLRLLTPNWMSRLPHWAYAGTEPDGYMSANEVADFLFSYALSFDAPVQSETRVEHVFPAPGGFEVVTDRGDWRASKLIIATGWCDLPAVPAIATRLDPGIDQVVPSDYKHPGQLAPGGVLVVGASATGVQLADELRRAGRDVVLAVGNHTRMPRRYRDRDIFYWLERVGALDRGVDELPSVVAARHEPSMQLIGRTSGENVDLTTLAAAGVALTGRTTWIDGTVVSYADDLHQTLDHANQRLEKVLGRIDDYIAAHGIQAKAQSHARFLSTPRTTPPAQLDLRRAGISTVIWATGYRRAYPWLHIPGALGADGEIDHRYGVTAVPGLYVLGQRFQRTRRSNFLGGVGADALSITHHLLAQPRRLVA